MPNIHNKVPRRHPLPGAASTEVAGSSSRIIGTLHLRSWDHHRLGLPEHQHMGSVKHHLLASPEYEHLGSLGRHLWGRWSIIELGYVCSREIGVYKG